MNFPFPWWLVFAVLAIFALHKGWTWLALFCVAAFGSELAGFGVFDQLVGLFKDILAAIVGAFTSFANSVR